MMNVPHAEINSAGVIIEVSTLNAAWIVPICCGVGSRSKGLEGTCRYDRTHMLPLMLLLAQTPWILDTDCGSDDYMAAAYLFAKANVRIEAILSVSGLAHAEPGARNMKRLAKLAGQPQLPVYVGAARALESRAEFPADWRKTSDELPGVTLPAPSHPLERTTAVAYLEQRLRKPARILALGPLTNLALVLRKTPALAANIEALVIMGGAIHVSGNLPDGGYYQTANRHAEWNLYIDPLAAEIVFRHVRTIRLVPLDATNKVPFRPEHLAAFNAQAKGPLGDFMKQILKMDEPLIKQGIMYAWDPLAAVAAVEPALVPMKPASVAVSLKKNEEGRTAPVAGKPNIEAALDANGRAFHEEFLRAFAKPRVIR